MPALRLALLLILTTLHWGCYSYHMKVPRDPQQDICSRSHLVPIEWFSAEIRPSRGVVIVVHGLNIRPSAMDPISASLQESGYHVARITLSGHDHGPKQVAPLQWEENLLSAYCAVQKQYPEQHLHLLGYSLGGLVAVSLLDKMEQVTISSMTLLAPALSIKEHVQLLRLLTWLRHLGVSLPALTPKPYRVHNFTSLSAYHALQISYDSVRELSRSADLNQIPAQIYFSSRDELICDAGLHRWLKQNRLTDWQVKPIEHGNDRELEFNHLFLDESSLGSSEWQSMMNEITSFLNSTN